MNPDELLAAYAAARARGTANVGASIESAGEANSGSPVEGGHHQLRPQSTASNNPFRQSMVSEVSQYTEALTGEKDEAGAGQAK